jgi:hypothetical protein
VIEAGDCVVDVRGTVAGGQESNVEIKSVRISSTLGNDAFTSQ